MATRKSNTDFSNGKDYTMTTIVEKDDNGNIVILDSFMGVSPLPELLKYLDHKHIIEKWIASAFGVPPELLK